MTNSPQHGSHRDSKTGPERVAYFNGEIVPESEVRIPLRDAGFVYGYAAFDTIRTVRHELFRLSEHTQRLWHSLGYLGIDPGLSPAALEQITREVVARNLPLIGADEDYWVTQRVTLGQLGERGWQPTVIVECRMLPLKERARLFRDGIDLQVSTFRRTPPEAVSPRAKTQNYVNLLLADRQIKAIDPHAWSLLLDHRGNLCEGLGSNLFLVRDGRLLTPREQMVLPGISRSVVFELAQRLGIECEEVDLDPYDASAADEMFLTSTSLCMCPVSRFEGRPVGDGSITGPVTRRLIDAWIEELGGFDFVAQYLRRLDTDLAQSA